MRQIEMRENHPAWQRLRFEVVDHSEIEGKKSQRLLDAKERAREYKLELEKMRIRVESQPTLFERQSAVSLIPSEASPSPKGWGEWSGRLRILIALYNTYLRY